VSIAHEWGSTPADRAIDFPCDRHLADAEDILYRAVAVEAPPAIVFRWLCQLRAAPYSYDWIDNWGRESPRTLTPGLDELAVGQRVMVFDLVEFEVGRHLTLVLRDARGLFGDVACTYLVAPQPDGTSRIVVKMLVRYPTGPLGSLARYWLPWGDLVMMRRQLLNLKSLAERDAEVRAAADSPGGAAFAPR
jgi:hypothetical protein